jgi:hypothetical protein
MRWANDEWVCALSPRLDDEKLLISGQPFGAAVVSADPPGSGPVPS